LTRENLAPKFGTSPRDTKVAAAILAGIFALALAACGGQESASNDTPQDSGEQQTAGTSAQDETKRAEETTQARATVSERGGAAGEAAELAKAEVGPKEITNMIPADRKKPDLARPLPEDPPEGIKVYPATTNRSVRGPIEYDREPPTNGNHAPVWQNCGFYEKPVQNRYAVHSMDHGVVWITYRPNLPAEQVNELRSYGDEPYVLVSPYPGQDAPVIATSWRVQLKLNSADDPRLRQFVNQFRISTLSPLSGNRCSGGVGRPET
jgi:hypothetical protein